MHPYHTTMGTQCDQCRVERVVNGTDVTSAKLTEPSEDHYANRDQRTRPERIRFCYILYRAWLVIYNWILQSNDRKATSLRDPRSTWGVIRVQGNSLLGNLAYYKQLFNKGLYTHGDWYWYSYDVYGIHIQTLFQRKYWQNILIC